MTLPTHRVLRMVADGPRVLSAVPGLGWVEVGEITTAGGGWYFEPGSHLKGSDGGEALWPEELEWIAAECRRRDGEEASREQKLSPAATPWDGAP